VDTGFRFYYPLSLAGDGSFYEDLSQNNSHYYPTWKWENEQAIDVLKNNFNSEDNFSILEIGCGEGFFLKAVRNFFQNADLHGLELNAQVVEKLQGQNYSVYNQDLDSHANQKPESYNFIVAFQVLEHVPDVQSFINSCLHALKPGGMLFFGVPNNGSYLFKNDFFHTLNLPPHHMGLWDKYSLQKLPLFFQMQTMNVALQPPDLNNLGIYFKVWLKKNIPTLQNILYPIFRIPVKLLLRIFKPASGHTVIAIYRKNN
jgi:SAM-dependent methyltransferase